MAKKDNKLQKYLRTFIKESDKVDQTEVWTFTNKSSDLEYVDFFWVSKEKPNEHTIITNVVFDEIIWYLGVKTNQEELMNLFTRADFHNAPKAWYDKLWKDCAEKYNEMILSTGDYLAKHKIDGKENCDLEYCNMHTQKT